MRSHNKYSPVFKPLPLIVGIRVNVDGNSKNFGNVYLVIFKKGNWRGFLQLADSHNI